MGQGSEWLQGLSLRGAGCCSPVLALKGRNDAARHDNAG